jgi:hypothetical protein
MFNRYHTARTPLARCAAFVSRAARAAAARGAALFVGGALLFAIAAGPLTASANGVPQRIQLAYQPGLSTWGPQDAHGEADLSYAEMVVHVTTSGLPALNGESYGIWLANSTTNKAVPVGSLAAAANGSATYDGKLTNVDGYDYDLMMITVQPADGSSAAPSDKRSIGGFFTAIKKQDTSANAIASDTQPTTLPNTGDTVSATSASSHRHTVAMALFALGGVSLYLTMRTMRSKRTRHD